MIILDLVTSENKMLTYIFSWKKILFRTIIKTKGGFVFTFVFV